MSHGFWLFLESVMFLEKSRWLLVTCQNACHFFLRSMKKQKIEMDAGGCAVCATVCGESPRNIEKLLQFWKLAILKGLIKIQSSLKSRKWEGSPTVQVLINHTTTTSADFAHTIRNRKSLSDFRRIPGYNAICAPILGWRVTEFQNFICYNFGYFTGVELFTAWCAALKNLL